MRALPPLLAILLVVLLSAPSASAQGVNVSANDCPPKTTDKEKTKVDNETGWNLYNTTYPNGYDIEIWCLDHPGGDIRVRVSVPQADGNKTYVWVAGCFLPDGLNVGQAWWSTGRFHLAWGNWHNASTRDYHFDLLYPPGNLTITLTANKTPVRNVTIPAPANLSNLSGAVRSLAAADLPQAPRCAAGFDHGAAVAWDPGAGLALASATQTSLSVQWPAAEGIEGVTTYRVAIDGGSPVDVGAIRDHTFEGLAAGSQHAVRVEACDVEGNCTADGPQGTFATQKPAALPGAAWALAAVALAALVARRRG